MQDTTKSPSGLILAAISAATLFLPSCGEESLEPAVTGSGEVSPYQPVARATAEVDPDAGKLIPSTTLAIARIQEIDGLIREAKVIAEAFQRGAGNFIDIAPLAGMADLRARDIDMTGSLFVSVNMTQMGPMPSFIVPATDAQDAADTTSLPAAVSGKSLGLSMTEKPVVGASTPTLGAGLATADIAMRVDLKTLLAQFQGAIDPYLDANMLADMDRSVRNDPAALAMLGTMVESAKQILDTAELLDVMVSLDGGALDLEVVVKVSGGSMAVPSGHAVTLAQLLPMTDASMFMFADADWPALMDSFMPLYNNMAAAMPAEQASAFKKLLGTSKDLYKSLQGGMGIAMDLTPNGLQGIGLMESREPTKFIEQYLAFAKDYPDFMNSGALQGGPAGDFMQLGPVTKDTIGGVEFSKLTLKTDLASLLKADPNINEEQLAGASTMAQAFFGQDGMSFGLGAYNNLVVLTVGDTDSQAPSILAAVKKGQRHSGGFVDNVAKRLHSRPSYLMGGDIRRLLTQLQQTVGKVAPMPMPEVPAGDPVFAWLSLSTTANSYGLQAHVDLTGLAEIAKAMSPR